MGDDNIVRGKRWSSPLVGSEGADGALHVCLRHQLEETIDAILGMSFNHHLTRWDTAPVFSDDVRVLNYCLP